MIVNKILAICPACDERVEIDMGELDTAMEACRSEVLLSFKCTQCGEYIEKEAVEKE